MEKLACFGLSTSIDKLNDAMGPLDLELVPVDDFADLARLAGEDGVTGAVVRFCDESSKAFCRETRLSPDLPDLPMVALVEDQWCRDVANAFLLGVDDYLPMNDLTQLPNKIMAIRAEGAPSGTYLSGKVVLADPDRTRRVFLSRHLRKMGLEVQFAVDQGIPTDPGVKLVVAHCALPPSGASPSMAAYRDGPGEKIPWVITGKKDELRMAMEDLEEHSNFVFFDLDSDPTQIAFTANKLLIGKGRALRRSERIDYETPIWVEMLDDDVSLWGFSYNINLGGLYVRTLIPPALGTMIRMEFAPPTLSTRVKVEGKVVWRQEFSRERGYPSGFGVQYSETMTKEVERKLDSCYRVHAMEHDIHTEAATEEFKVVAG